MAADVAMLHQRVERMQARKATADNVYELLAEFLLPTMQAFTGRRTQGDKQTIRLYHSRGITAPDKLARSMHGTVTSPASKWFSLKMRQEEINEVKPIRDWLEECAARMYLAINQSAFSSAVGEVYGQFVVFGTAAILVEEGAAVLPAQRQPDGRYGYDARVFPGFRFRCIPLSEFWIEENGQGKVDTLARRLTMNARSVFTQWPDTAGTDVAEKATDRPDDPMTVWHLVTPRYGRDPRRANAGNMPWSSCYYLESPRRLLAEGGFHEFPFMVPRWATSPGEVYGRGPGHTAYPDIRSLNRVRELKLSAGAKAVDPPLLAKHEAVLGSLSLNPAAINVITEENAIQALDGHARFDVASLIENDLTRDINDVFYLAELELREGPQMTATEIVARQEEKQRLLGPTMGRLHAEFLSPFIERCFGIMARAGALPPMPDELAQFGDAADIDVQYEGPLARAQRSADLVAIERKNQWVISILPAKPDVLDLFDFDAEGRHVAEVAGVPSDLVADPKLVERVRAQRQQLAQQQAMLQTVAGAAESAGKAAPMVDALTKARQVPVGSAA